MPIIPSYETTTVILYIVGGAIISFSSAANVLVLLTLCIKKVLRKPTYTVLVTNLSAADLTISICFIAQILTRVAFPTSMYICITWVLLFPQGLFMTFYFTCIISLNRYLSARNSSWKNTIFNGRRKYALLYIPSAIVAAINVGFTVIRVTTSMSCNLGDLLKDQAIYLTLLGFPPFLGTLFLYIIAVYEIYKPLAELQGPGTFEMTNEGTTPNVAEIRRNRHVSAMKTLGIIIALLMFTTAPFLLVFLLLSLDIHMNSFLLPILGIGPLVNSALNPIVYTWRLHDFRVEIRNMFCPCCSVESVA